MTNNHAVASGDHVIGLSYSALFGRLRFNDWPRFELPGLENLRMPASLNRKRTAETQSNNAAK